MDRITSPNSGGIENVSWQLSKEFVRTGHRVYFLSIRPPQSTDDISSLCGDNSYFILPDSTNLHSERNLNYLKNSIEINQIDIIMNQWGGELEISNILFDLRKRVEQKIYIVSVLHNDPNYLIKLLDDSYFISEWFGYNILKWLRGIIIYLTFKLFYLKVKTRRLYNSYLYIYTNSDAFVLLSKKHEESFLKQLRTEHPQQLHSITNPIVPFSYNTQATTPKDKTILYVGRLIRAQKRPDRILKIWKRLHKDFPDWKFVIVGGGSYRADMERYVIDNKIERVEFKGFQDPTEYYQKSSIFTLVSPCEGFGLVLTEAQQAGCIPIAYNSFAAVTDIIEDGKNGILVKPFDSKKYESTLRELMNNEHLREQLSKNCIEKDYSKFKVEYTAQKWIKLFEDLKSK